MLSSEPRRRFENRVSLCHWIRGPSLDHVDVVHRTFQEALEVTSTAKARFMHDGTDLYERGKRLVTESILAGVTSMRAFVEIDRIVSMHCLNAGLRLKKEFIKECEIQLVVFAQDPLFDDPSATEPGDNYRLLVEAAATLGVSVIGSAPYVEPSLDQAKRNIKLVLNLAKEGGLHVDFHLDYNLNSSAQPLIYDVIQYMRELQWTSLFSRGSMRQVTIGHGTRYSLFDDQEWRDLKESIGDLPISFVALPQSDLYMMGKTYPRSAKLAPRGTIPVPFVADLGLDIALSVNNVENAFTPQGSVDPLPLCSLGVAIYQDASERACQILLVS
ncbi:Metallo-dependent hydrolase [Stereum hirsutum FP-91666 SS1]|uniref:Metallo-dependent hydrolase n=1 Tax=Stereum hirsutum (strain FP-91666) TaxID=721885 RepID=UPI000444A65E|nr:Metallo-dependent hydrolase [Stereum hirsutum FP-91666 SS1]EIM86032.1 Metallo-dependent hydrolase [Stereum hirsutum FP-91666 SS1]